MNIKVIPNLCRIELDKDYPDQEKKQLNFLLSKGFSKKDCFVFYEIDGKEYKYITWQFNDYLCAVDKDQYDKWKKKAIIAIPAIVNFGD